MRARLLLLAAVTTLAGCFDPPPECELPFAAGTCKAKIPVATSQDGECVARDWGGCGGNANRFTTQAECVAVCEGRSCPPGTVPARTCLFCGEAGGCGAERDGCAKPCASDAECTDGRASEPHFCIAGVCQAGRCD